MVERKDKLISANKLRSWLFENPFADTHDLLDAVLDAEDESKNTLHIETINKIIDKEIEFAKSIGQPFMALGMEQLRFVLKQEVNKHE